MMKETIPKLAFFDRGNASYILSDIRLLEGSCTIKRHSFLARRASQLPWAWLRQAIRAMCIVPTSQAVFVHFAGWNSIFPLLIARMFRKHSVLFVHGTDCVGFPSIGYGNFRKWPLARVTCLSLRLARKVVAVDDSLVSSVNTYATLLPSHQGIKHYCKGLKTPTMVLPHGFEPDDWPIGNGERDVDVLTVGVGLGEEWRRQLKGVDLLISAAAKFPQRKFVVIGMPKGAVKDLPPNVETYSEVPPSELRGWYQRSVCYVQVSMSEGFGCALAEAMLSGCIPVVSDVGAMPELVGDVGSVVSYKSVGSLEAKLREVLTLDRDNFSKRARERIVHKWPLGQRFEGLVRILYEDPYSVVSGESLKVLKS